MENGFKDCDVDDDPKKLLIPGALPIPVHTILNRTDDSKKNDDELPSTIDMDALKGPPPTDSQYLNPMGWKRSPRVKTTVEKVEIATDHHDESPVIERVKSEDLTPKPITDRSENISARSVNHITTPATTTTVRKVRKVPSEASGSSSESEDSDSTTSTSSSSGSSGSTTDGTDSDNISTKSSHSLPRNSKQHNGNLSSSRSLSTSSNTNSSSSNNGDAVLALSKSSIPSVVNGEKKKPELSKSISSRGASNNLELSKSRRSNMSKKIPTVKPVTSDQQVLKVAIQDIVTKIQKNGDLTITPISAPSTTSAISSNIISSPKLSTISSMSVTPYMKSTPLSTTVTPLSTVSGRKRRSNILSTDDARTDGNTTSVLVLGGSHQHSTSDARQRLPPKKRLVHHSQYQDKDEVQGKVLHSAPPVKSAATISIHTLGDSTKSIADSTHIKAANQSTPLNGQSSKVIQQIVEQKVKAAKPVKSPDKKTKGTRRSTRVPKRATSSPKSPKVLPSPCAVINKKAAILGNIFSAKRNQQTTRIRTKGEVKEVKPTVVIPSLPPAASPIPVPLPPHLSGLSSELEDSSTKRKCEEFEISDFSMTERERREHAKRIKLDIEALLETPTEPIEIVDASAFEDDNSLNLDLVDLVETPSKPIEIIDASDLVDSLTPLPVISTTNIITAGFKKRRKVNRTGFPMKKKKRKFVLLANATTSTIRSPAITELASYTDNSNSLDSKSNISKSEPSCSSKPSNSSSSIPVSPNKRRGRKPKAKSKRVVSQPNASAISDLIDVANSEIQKIKSEESPDIAPPEYKPLPATAASTSKNSKKSSTASFASSLTERIKIRKRNSVDGSTSSSSSDIPSALGISPALLHIPNRPIILPQKANYLRGGLLSKDYKGGARVTPEMYLEQVKRRLKNPPDERINIILPTPAYAAAFIRERQIDYVLPYDIWCFGVLKANEKFEQWKVEQQIQADKIKELNLEKRRASEPGMSRPRKIQMPEVIPDSWNFRKIRQNTYLGYNKPPVTTEPEEDQLCECDEAEFKCSGEDCLNRLVFTECPPACGENCTNRRIQKHDWAPDLKKFLTYDKGYGVRTLTGVKKGNFILEYVGEVVPDAVFKERMHTIYANDTHHYCLQLDGGRVIDGHRSGGLGRFVNHSCEPNCEMQKWSVSGLSRMALFALRDIEVGEELSYDYNFSLYNPSEGQPCHCGSVNCRGVIGVRTKQNGNKTEGGISKRKSANTKGPHAPADSVAGGHAEPAVLEKMKILSRKERNFIYTHHCLLVRNYEKIRRMRGEVKDKYGDRVEKIMSSWILRFRVGSAKNKSVNLPGEDPKLAKLAHVAQTMYELFASISKAKDEHGKYLCEPFMEPPPKRMFPKFYENFENGSKLNGLKSVEKGILRGEYKTIQQLEADIALILNRFSIAFASEKPEVQNVVGKIKKLYKNQKQKAIEKLDPFIVPDGRTGNSSAVALAPDITAAALPKFIAPSECKEVIRCICGTYCEEGTMIQCEKCLVWQHCDCMKEKSVTQENGMVGSEVKKEEKPYYCELCEPRDVDEEILLNPSLGISQDGITFFLTLKREDGFIVRRNDTVYVLREWPANEKTLPDGTEKPRKTFLNAGKLIPSDCDIFRIEELRKDKDGNRFAFGYNYLRPYETYHEPNRRFYPNEILRAPITELISLDLIHGRCWVVDSATFCKGRPKNCVEEHLYICDMRVDKKQRCFSKVGRNQSQGFCTKDFAFNHFETKLKIQRNFHPHGPPSPDFKLKASGTVYTGNAGEKGKGRNNKTEDRSKYKYLSSHEVAQIAKQKSEKRENVNRAVGLIHLRIPDFQTDKIDMSHLLISNRKKSQA